MNIESVDLRLVAGHIVASGNLNMTSKAFDFQGRAENIELARLGALANRPNVSLSGVANFNAHVTGSLSDRDFSAYQITFDGEGRDVVINGRPAGTLTLTGRTENKQLSINLTSGVLGQPQVVAAQINLASPSLPATIETTLTNAVSATFFDPVAKHRGIVSSGRANGRDPSERQPHRRRRQLLARGSLRRRGIVRVSSVSKTFNSRPRRR